MAVFYICYLLICIYKRKTEEIVKSAAGLIPVIVMVIGIVMDKLYISLIGAVLIFTITPLIIKKFNNN